MPKSLTTIARVLLFVVIAVAALYQLQRYAPVLFAAPSRAALIGALSLMVVWAAPRRLQTLSPLLWALAAGVALTGLHTLVAYGGQLAVAATARFSNVMVLAPLAALLLRDAEDLRPVFLTYPALMIAASLSALYQFAGGSLETLVQGYVAIRGDLTRYMTVVGEPNVGGMLAVLAFVAAVAIPRRTLLAVTLAAPAVLLLLLSLSKAAFLGFGLAGLALLVLAPGPRSATAVRLVASVLLGLMFTFALGAGDYVSVSWRAVFGGLRGEPSAFQDFLQRQGAGLGTLISIIFGESFGVAGSAAQESRGYDAGVPLPHNSYAEMFITGGLMLLIPVVLLMASAFRTLFVELRERPTSVGRCALICLALLACWMLGYPVIYEPVTGALFWVIIGYGNRPRMERHANRPSRPP